MFMAAGAHSIRPAFVQPLGSQSFGPRYHSWTGTALPDGCAR